jgi:hypothetical protein
MEPSITVMPMTLAAAVLFKTGFGFWVASGLNSLIMRLGVVLYLFNLNTVEFTAKVTYTISPSTATPVTVLLKDSDRQTSATDGNGPYLYTKLPAAA